MLYHKGKFLQRGAGLGNIFGSLFRSIAPMVKKFLPTAKAYATKIIQNPVTKSLAQTASESAGKAGMQLATDILSGENVGESLKKGVKTVGSDVIETAKKKMTGGRKRKHVTTMTGGRKRKKVATNKGDRKKPKKVALPKSKGKKRCCKTKKINKFSEDIFDD